MIVWQSAIGTRLGVASPVSVLVEPGKTTGFKEIVFGSDPERAFRPDRQCRNLIIRQSAMGTCFGIALPISVFVKSRQTTAGSDPKRTVCVECQRCNTI